MYGAASAGATLPRMSAPPTAGPARPVAVALTAAVLAALVGAVAPVPGRAWLFGAGAFALPGLLIALGSRREGRTAPAAWVVLILVEAAGLGMLATAGGSGGPFLLPWPAWLLVIGLGLIPLLMVPALFARDFDRFAPDGAALSRLRAARLARLANDRRDGRTTGDPRDAPQPGGKSPR